MDIFFFNCCPGCTQLVFVSVCVCVQKDQLNLQSVDILSLRESLQVEQQRYRQLWDDRETVVTRLHSQIRQLQQGRDDYYTKNQELQVCTHPQKTSILYNSLIHNSNDATGHI